MVEPFSITPLQNSLIHLCEGLKRYQQDINDLQIRDGLIYRFTLSYELSHKILKRYLEWVSPNPTEYDEMSFQQLIRSANEQGLLLGNWADWRIYRDMRSRTSHTYDEETAIKVVEGIPKFLMEAEFLVAQLEQHINAAQS